MDKKIIMLFIFIKDDYKMYGKGIFKTLIFFWVPMRATVRICSPSQKKKLARTFFIWNISISPYCSLRNDYDWEIIPDSFTWTTGLKNIIKRCWRELAYTSTLGMEELNRSSFIFILDSSVIYFLSGKEFISVQQHAGKMAIPNYIVTQ